jgi:NAD(P)H-dependent FMN reductase
MTMGHAMSLHVLALTGSARDGSYNRMLVRLASDRLAAQGLEVVEVDLRALDLPIYDEDLEQREGQPAAVGRLRRVIAQADGLLIASPEYNHSIAPLLKNAIDWVSHPMEQQPFRGKPTAIMSAAARPWGGTRMLPHLRDVLVDLGCVVVPTLVAVAKASEAFDSDGRLLSSLSATALGRAMTEFADEVRLRRGLQLICKSLGRYTSSESAGCRFSS